MFKKSEIEAYLDRLTELGTPEMQEKAEKEEERFWVNMGKHARGEITDEELATTFDES